MPTAILSSNHRAVYKEPVDINWTGNKGLNGIPDVDGYE
jgi:hypothetical protein